MAQIPGSVPLTGKVAPTDTTDTFATHIDIYGEGGYMTVADQAERNAITTERRKQGMAVFQNDTNKMYILQGGTANTNWTEFTGGGIATMQNVFDASTPNVDATDQSKTLILKASDVTLTADNDDPNAPATATGDLSLVSNSDIGGHHNTPTRLRLRGGQFGQGELGLLGIAGQNPLVSSPAVGDILVVDSLDPLAPGAPIWATEAKLKFAQPSALNVGNMQDIYNNSVGVVSGLDTNKPLTLVNGEINLDARTSGGQSGLANLKGEEGVEISSSNANVDINAPAGDFTISCLDQGQIQSNDKLTLSTNNGKLWVATPNGEIVIEEQTGTGNITLKTGTSSPGGDIILPGAGGNIGTPTAGDVLTAHSSGGELRWTSPGPAIQSIKVTLTSAQILNLHTTPVELIPAPTSNKFIVIFSVYSFLEFNTTPYTYQNNADIKCRYGNGTIQTNYAVLFTDVSIGTSQDTYRALNGWFPFASSPPFQAWLPNTNVQVYCDVANINGDSPITFYISYMITDL